MVRFSFYLFFMVTFSSDTYIIMHIIWKKNYYFGNISEKEILGMICVHIKWNTVDEEHSEALISPLVGSIKSNAQSNL